MKDPVECYYAYLKKHKHMSGAAAIRVSGIDEFSSNFHFRQYGHYKRMLNQYRVVKKHVKHLKKAAGRY